MTVQCRLTHVKPIDYSRSRLGPLEPFLRQWSGQTVYLEPDRGNNGDILIMEGTRHLFKLLDLRITHDPAAGSVIFLKGGGAMTEQWAQSGFAAVKRFTAEFPNKPLVVLPSSYRFDNTDFPSLFKGRSAPAYLFCRELYSYDLLERSDMPAGVDIGYDHDLAFQLEGSPLHERLDRLAADSSYTLIAERHDGGERARSTGRRNSLKGRITRAVLPPDIHRKLQRRLVYPGDLAWTKKTPFSTEAYEVLKRIAPQCADLPVRAADISVTKHFSLDEFCTIIAKAVAVASQRLHVACLAYSLGKPLVMDPGFYYKIRGVYELSMATRSDVVLHSFQKKPAQAPLADAHAGR